MHAWQQQLCYWAAGDGGERSGERSESRCGAVRPGAATRDMFFFFAWHWARDCSKILFWNSLGVGCYFYAVGHRLLRDYHGNKYVHAH